MSALSRGWHRKWHTFMLVLIQMVQATSVETWWSSNDAVDLISFFQQKFGANDRQWKSWRMVSLNNVQIWAVLAGDTCAWSALLMPRFACLVYQCTYQRSTRPCVYGILQGAGDRAWRRQEELLGWTWWRGMKLVEKWCRHAQILYLNLGWKLRRLPCYSHFGSLVACSSTPIPCFLWCYHVRRHTTTWRCIFSAISLRRIFVIRARTGRKQFWLNQRVDRSKHIYIIIPWL